MPLRPERDWKYIVLHHTATDRGSVKSIDAQHRNRRDSQGRTWLGIGYHFVIGNGNGMPDGQIARTFRWNQQLHGAHAGSATYNQAGIGIVLVGNFERSRPTVRQLEAARRLVYALRRRYGIAIDDVVPHRQIRNTKCPGSLFPLDVFAGRGAGQIASLHRSRS